MQIQCMVDHSVGPLDECHESEASQALMFGFDSVSPEKSCVVVDLVRFVSLSVRVFVFLNVIRKE